MNSCYGCTERCVFYDSDGKAHSCHETCERHAKDREKSEAINKKKREIQVAQDETADAIKRLVGKYKWNRR